MGYKLQSKTTGTDDFRICSVTASTGIFSEVAVVQSFVGKEDVKIKSKEVGCVCLSHNTFYTYKKIGNSTTGTLTLEIPPRNVLQKNKAFQILLWIKGKSWDNFFYLRARNFCKVSETLCVANTLPQGIINCLVYYWVLESTSWSQKLNAANDFFFG